MVQKSIDAATKDAIRDSMKGNRDEAIRKRVTGDDELTKKYLGKMNSMHMKLDPPEDPSITTLWLGNVEPDISETDIRDQIYSYGHILNINLVRAGKCAFVEWASREMAEHAASQLYKALLVKGRAISVNWAKPRAQAFVEGGGASSSLAGMCDDEQMTMLPPPGMERAAASAYALPGLSQPMLQPPPPPGPPPLGSGTGTLVGSVRPREGEGAEPTGKKPRPPPGGASMYPSMSASRMGAKI
jgi:RNA recognition motif-containing protein